MSDLYLFHYYESACGPFKSLSELSEEEAHLVMQRLKREGRVFAGRRSADYMQIRRQLEQRAREMFIRKGGKPARRFPHYMTLGPCDWIKGWYVNGKEVKIRLDRFDPLSISFTYGDLFPTMRYLDGKPYRQQVYLKDEMLGMIERYGWPQQWNEDGSQGPERYIEAQIWDDVVVSRAVTG